MYFDSYILTPARTNELMKNELRNLSKPALVVYVLVCLAAGATVAISAIAIGQTFAEPLTAEVGQ